MDILAKDKQIILVGHITRGHGYLQNLRDYFCKNVMDFILITHPLYTDKDSTTSYFKSQCGIYKKGKLVKETEAFELRKPDALRHIKEIISTIYWVIRYAKTHEEVFFLGQSNINVIAGLMTKRVLGIKKIIFIVPDYSKDDRFSNKLMNAIYNRVDKYCIKKVDYICNGSNRVLEERVKAGISREKNLVFPNTVNFDYIPRFNIEENRGKIIAYVGALRKDSGLEALLDILPEIVESVNGTRLLIIGGGEDEEKIKKIISDRKLEEKTEFLGYVPYEKTLNYLTKCSIGFAPYSDNEPQFLYYCDPSKVKAYLACGCPVIIKDLPEIAQKIQERQAGFIYKHNYELKGLFLKLLCDPILLKDFRRNALEFAKEYDNDRVCEDILNKVTR